MVDCFIQLFLKDCCKCPNQEDLNQRVINFDGLNLDVIFYQFCAILPPLFHKFNDRSNKNNNPRSGMRNGGKGKRKGGTNGNKEEQRNSKKRSARRITNDDQVEDFKMAKGKTWEGTFQGKCPESQVNGWGCLCALATTQKGNARTKAVNTARCMFQHQRSHKK